MKQLIIIICMIAICLTILTCGKDKTSNPPASTVDWTILVYSDGNNDLDEIAGGQSYCIQNIQNLEKIGSTDKVQVIVMSSATRTGGFARYYHIEHYTDEVGNNISSPVLLDKGAIDMSNPQTLNEFLAYGIEHYQASHYALVIDDHGRGWPGICADQMRGSGEVMSLVDLAGTIEQTISEKGIGKFDVIALHSPSMAMVEVAYELRNCADFLVASEFSTPMGSLLSGNVWLNALVGNSSVDGRELAINIGNAIYETGANYLIAMQISVIEISKIERLISRIENFRAQLLLSAVDHWNEVLNAWITVHSTSYDYAAYVDIKNFAYELEQQPNLQSILPLTQAADSVISANDDAVIFSATTISENGCGGLNIHLPFQREYYDSTNYARIDFHNTQWTSLISRFINASEEQSGYTLTVSTDPPNAGNWTVNPFRDHYQSGDTVLLSTSANGNYHFVNWLIQGEYHYSLLAQIVFSDSDIVAIANFEMPQDDSTATISGRVYWPGHILSSHTYVFADTVVDNNVHLWGQAHVNVADSSYTMVIENIRSPHEIAIEAQDDVNNSGLWDERDAGDGWGFYDYDGDGYWYDRIIISPGQTISGVDIVLREFLPK